jgi:hypothetical protein
MEQAFCISAFGIWKEQGIQKSNVPNCIVEHDSKPYPNPKPAKHDSKP